MGLPVPRRRRIQGLATAALVVAAQLGLGLAELVDAIDLSREGLLAALISSGAALHPLQQAMAGQEQRALDRAGHAVMAASGYDPATLARQVFGDRRNPPWFRRVLSAEPAPGRRIADADRWPSRRDSLR